MSATKKIIHIDMDAFFASVEQRDHPEYKGKPLVVGGNSERGVVAAASYEARRFGIKSAMSSKIAARKCPYLIFAKPNFEQYLKVSAQIREIFFRFTDLVEPLSIDEAFLDVTQNKFNMRSATQIAVKIKKMIFDETGLTASAGVSYNKFLAKIASDYKKPDGIFVIEPKNAQDFIDKLPVEKFFGVGHVTAQKMHKLGIHFGADLKQYDINFLNRNFGKNGKYFFDIARGTDNREVVPDRAIKSIGAERTFETDIFDINIIKSKAEELSKKIIERCNKKQLFGKTLTLKIKYADFKQITKSKTFDYKLNSYEKIISQVINLINNSDFSSNQVRLIGVQISNFKDFEFAVPVQLQIQF